MPTLNLNHLPPDQTGTWHIAQYAYYTEDPPLHDHAFHELFWVVEGQGTHHLNGEARPLRPGLLVFIRPRDCHGFSGGPSDTPLRFINVTFRSRIWRGLVARFFSRVPQWLESANPGDREFLLTAAEIERFHAWSLDLAAGQRDRIAMEAFLLPVLNFMERRHSAPAAADGPPWLREVLIHSGDPRNFRLGTRALAAVAGVTPEHLAREIRRCLGVTPTDLLNDARLSHAARQLANSGRPILDIMYECGWENQGHFYQLFRKRFGTTPRQFRLQRGG